MDYKLKLKEILTTHQFDYIAKPIILEYNSNTLSNVFNSYPNNLNTSVDDWFKQDTICENFFPHQNCIIIHKENNEWRGGTVFSLKYRPVCDYDKDYYLIDNVSIDNLLEYIGGDMCKNLNKYYNLSYLSVTQDHYKYWFKVSIT